MKIKMILKTIVGFLFVLATHGNIYADDISTLHSSRSVNEKIANEDIEKFFYNKGYDDGYNDGREVGREEAKKKYKQALKKYSKYIKSLEAGKYLSKKGKITPPRIYQEKNPDGSVSVIVRGCNIEGELSPDDILMFPRRENNGYSGMAGNSSSSHVSKYSHSEHSDSVFLAGVDRKKSSVFPEKADSYIRGTFKMFPDTNFYRKLFAASPSALEYSIQPNNQIKVMFRSEKEANSFINRHGLERGKDYN